MPRIEVQLPSVLSPVVRGRGGSLRFAVEAATFAQALDAIRREHPHVALHLFDESGGFRPHVLCFLNGTNSRWLDSGDAPLKAGDTLRIIQAVSGG